MSLCMTFQTETGEEHSKMRILVVASCYLPHPGGLETVVHEVSKQWQLAGHAITIVTNRYPRTLPKREEIDNISVQRLHFLYPQLAYLESGRVDLWLAGWVYFPLTFVQLLILTLRFRPDVVNLHYLGSPGFFLWILHHLVRFRLVVSLHGGDVDGEPKRSRFKRWLFGALLGRAERVTTCSRALLDQAITLVPEITPKAHVIHNGVDVELFANARPYCYERPYLLGVGKLEHHKGFDVLLAAFAQVEQRFPEVDLLIAGDGHERAALQSQIQEVRLNGRVHLLGAVNREQVASLMRGSLAFVIPSRREPFGIVALEAMAAGRPIIATRAGGLTEALAGAEVVWTQPGDVDSLKDGLCVGIGKNNQSQATVERNQQLAAQFDWATIANRYITVFSR